MRLPVVWGPGDPILPGLVRMANWGYWVWPDGGKYTVCSTTTISREAKQITLYFRQHLFILKMQLRELLPLQRVGTVEVLVCLYFYYFYLFLFIFMLEIYHLSDNERPIFREIFKSRLKSCVCISFIQHYEGKKIKGNNI